MQRAREVQATIDRARGESATPPTQRTAGKSAQVGEPSRPRGDESSRVGDAIFGRPGTVEAGNDAPGAKATLLPTARADSDEADAPGPLVSRGLAALANQRGGTLAMRLDPPSLGDVRITMTIRGGSVVADIAPSTTIAQQLLGGELATLKSALERQGLVVDRITVHAPPPSARGDVAVPSAAANDPREQQRSDSSSHDRGDRQGGFRHDAGGGQSRGRGRESEDEPGRRQQRNGARRAFSSLWSDLVSPPGQ